MFLLGCQDSDRELYARALASDDPAALCSRIGDASLRGDCLSYDAARARDPERCEAIDEPLWREECYFLVADEAELTGDAAVDACRRAGRFRHNCLGHAIGREVRGTEDRHRNVGDELALHAAIEAVVARYKPGAPDDQRRVTADTLTARILASRWQDGPFDASLCGRAPEALCARAYRTNLDATPPEIDLEGVCEATVTLDAVHAVGARIWTPESEALALRSWAELCDDLNSGRIQRDASLGMGVPPRPGVLPGEMIP